MFADRRRTSFGISRTSAAAESRIRSALGPLQPSVASTRPGSRQALQEVPRSPNTTNTADGIRAVDASLGGHNIRIARRAIVTTTLKRSLAVDVPISNFDVCLYANLLATCMGKVMYLWALDTLTVIHKFGRNTGSVHRENIRDCKFDPMGTLLASCGDDMRIVIWNIKNFRAEKVIEAHKGIIYQIEFSEDGERLLSASDDGRVQVWEWKTGTLIGSYIRHPSAVRCFDFNYDHPDRIICGRSDGHITTWDTVSTLVIDDIKPDSDWMERGVENNLMGWMDVNKHHTGSILCVRIAPNNRLMASGATDHTCRLWNITSYAKNYQDVQHEKTEAKRAEKKLEQLMRIDDEQGFEPQVVGSESMGLKIGEVPLGLGFHADLLHTFRHEGPVLSVRFNNSSSIIITGCMDSTCRLWSARRGDLLFQINVPAPVSSIFVDEADDMYCICENRLLFFGIKAAIKEEDLPMYWQRRSIERLAEEEAAEEARRQTPGYARGASGGRGADEMDKPLTAEEEEFINQLEEEMKEGGGQKEITTAELRKLISHGLVSSTFLDTLLDQYTSVDSDQLATNMKKNNLTSRDILRLFVNTPFHPRDILTAMASKADNTDSLFENIRKGNPIMDIMVKMGFKHLEAGAGAEGRTIFLDLKDLYPRGRGLYPTLPQRRGGGRFGPPQGLPRRRTYYEEMEDEDWDQDDETYLLEDELGVGKDYAPRGRAQPRGKILHFIPSEQIKLLKDFHANRDLKPIFLRDLVLDLNPLSGYPNFNVEAETRDTRPLVAQRTMPRPGVRFNEMVTLNRATRQKQVARRPYGGRTQPFNIRSLPLQFGPGYERVRASLASSQTIFQPARYLRARGLNIHFGPRPHGAVQGGNRMHGHVYAEPIVIRQHRNQDFRQQFVVGRSISMREQSID